MNVFSNLDIIVCSALPQPENIFVKLYSGRYIQAIDHLLLLYVTSCWLFQDGCCLTIVDTQKVCCIQIYQLGF